MTVSLLFGSDPVQVPVQFGKYKYVKTIATGSFSSVILVENRAMPQLYACKVVSRAVLIEADIFERFDQEVRVLPSFRHPNIVRFEEVVFMPDLIAVVMEYCPHGDLFTYIATSGAMPEGRARELFRQVADALAYVHERDVCHRDVKPDNVLLDEQMNAKLADFGLCHSSSSKRLLTTPCGSPLYAPPEIIANREYDGKMADVWSLGIMLYTMVTGMLPWTETNHVRLFREILEARIDIPHFLSQRLQALLERMLEKDPAARPTVASILEDPWVLALSRDAKIAKASSMFVSHRAGAPAPRQGRFGETTRVTQMVALRRQVPTAASVIRQSSSLTK
jgi:serine/threonine protein kinase